jgi:hypothetical protein
MTTSTVPEQQETGLIDNLAAFLSQAINKTDEMAAMGRVLALKKSHPEAQVDELVARLIRQKCFLTGAAGALTSGLALIGLPLHFGSIFKWQAELVLEIAAVHNRTLSEKEKLNIVLIVTGLSASATHLIRGVNRKVERKATARLPQSRAGKATFSLTGVAVSASTNIIITYLIGRRAQAYFQLDRARKHS